MLRNYILCAILCAGVLTAGFGSDSTLAQDFVQITEDYSCGRLGDDKLHVVVVTSDGFEVIKRGAASRRYLQELRTNNNRIKTLNDIKRTLRVKGPKTPFRVVKKAEEILSKVGEDLLGDDFEDNKIVKIDLAIARLKQRNQILNVYRREVSKCENQKFPGLNTISAIITTVFVPGQVDTIIGTLVAIPRPSTISKKVNAISACLVAKEVDHFGRPTGRVTASQRAFATDFCSYGTISVKNAKPLDCTGPLAGRVGLLISTALVPPSTAPGDDLAVNFLIRATELAMAREFKVVPVSKAPGRNCERLGS